jgi:hypothetical protein
MRGSLNCREPTKTLLLEAYDNIREIFQQGRWMEYLNRIRGYVDNVALKFAINYKEIRIKVAVKMV